MSKNVAYPEFLEPYMEFPSAIRSHVAIADSRLEVRAAVTDTTRKVFLEIIRRASVPNPEQPIWIRVDVTAKRLGVCTRTVSRTIKMLKEKGWLVRSNTHDGRNSQGEFNGCEYLLTPAMRRLMSIPEKRHESRPMDSNDIDQGRVQSPAAPLALAKTPDARAHQLRIQQVTPSTAIAASLPPGSGLSKALAIAQRRAAEERAKKEMTEHESPKTAMPEPVEKPVDNAVLPCEAEAEKCKDRTGLSSGAIYEVNKVFVLKEASLHKGGLFVNSETKKTIRLPFDLLPLVEKLGIRPDGVCKLMRIAKALGHRLQDVWAVKEGQFLNSGAKHGRAVKYFEFLLNCGEDFAYRARTKITGIISGKAEQPYAAPARNAPSHAPDQNTPSGRGSDAKERADSLAFQIKKIAEACRFKRFRHISKSFQVRFYGDDQAEVMNGFHRTIYTKEMMQGLYIGIMNGNLVEAPE